MVEICTKIIYIWSIPMSKLSTMKLVPGALLGFDNPHGLYIANSQFAILGANVIVYVLWSLISQQ